MKNKLTDLNDHLFAQLERLTDEKLTGEEIETEIRRASAVVQVADTIVENASLQLSAAKFVAENGPAGGKRQLPPNLALAAGGAAERVA